MLLLYNFFIFLYSMLAGIMGLFNIKAKLWHEGRRNLLGNIEKALRLNTAPVAWFHCASLGEFEQARPVIENFKNEFSTYRIFLTFFSPSGFEIRKDYAHADFVFYLPPDTRHNAESLINKVNPTIVFFTKYEFWYHYLHVLKSNKIPAISFSSIFRKEQIFFKSYGKFYLDILFCFDKLFVQDTRSHQLLIEYGIKQAEVSGDTRFDRVLEQAALKKEIPLVAEFKANKQLIIVGSSWPQDMDIIENVLSETPDIKIIIAPHEIREQEIVDLEKKFLHKAIRFSKAKTNDVAGYHVLIIDNIGMLSSLYQYAELAFIGGGFGKGIHNILEAAVYGMPVLFGPKYSTFREARDLINLNCAFPVHNSIEFKKQLDQLLSVGNRLNSISQKSREYVIANSGATKKIMQYCHTILTNRP